MRGSKPASRRCGIRGLAFIAALCALAAAPLGSALAGTVTVSLKTPAGAAAADVVVVFDPLDAMPPPTHTTMNIDQVNKRFVPKVNVIRTGTAVSFPNSDNIRHQVYSFSKPKTFSLKLYSGVPSGAVVFDKPGLVILGCNIHDTMVGFVAVADSPYCAKSSHAGTADLTLPPGRYRLRVWDPNLNTPIPPREITVTGEPLALPLTIDVAATRDEVADWTE